MSVGDDLEDEAVATDLRPPAVDPVLQALLANLDEAARSPLTPANLAARQRQDATCRPRPTVEELRVDGRFEVTELRTPSARNAGEVVLVSARPAGLGGPLPLLYYLHGGGMIMGNAWSVLPRLLHELALPLGLAVISVEYRLAPQTPYPGPLEDCWAGLVWATRHAVDLGLDPNRVIIGGKSAGCRAGRSARPADPRPRRSAADRPAAAQPDAGRPQQHLLQPSDGLPRHLGPHLQRHRLAGAARRPLRCRRPAALRGPRPCHRSHRAAPRLPRGRRGRNLPRRSRGLRGHDLAGRMAQPNSMSGPAPATASTPSPRTQPSATTPATPAPAGSAASSAPDPQRRRCPKV